MELAIESTFAKSGPNGNTSAISKELSLCFCDVVNLRLVIFWNGSSESSLNFLEQKYF